MWTDVVLACVCVCVEASWAEVCLQQQQQQQLLLNWADGATELQHPLNKSWK